MANRNNRAKATLLGLVMLAGGQAAHAQQEVPEVISPLRIETDQNGVNVISGKILPPIPAITVPAAPNLRFDWVANAAPYMNGKQYGAAGEVAQTNFSVHTLTGTSESFECPDFDCRSITGTGSAFVTSTNVSIFWRGGSGEQYIFDQRSFKTTVSPVTMRYYASSVTYPNGEVITFAYDAAAIPGSTVPITLHRPNKVTSNLGYFITITYHTNDVLSGAWGNPAQATLYKSSAPTTVLDQLTYSLDGSTITDIGGRVYTCSGCANNLSADLERSAFTLQLPGETSQTVNASAVSGSGVVGSVVRDGVTWTYTFTGLNFYTPTQTYLYSKLRVTAPEGYDMTYAIVNGDGRNVISKITDSIGRVTDLDHNTNYQTTEVIYPEGNKVGVVYDTVGNITSRTTTPKAGSGQTAVTETAHYVTSACGGSGFAISCFRPQWFEDSLDRHTDFLYNAAGQLTQQTDPPDATGMRRRTIIEYETSTGLSRRHVVRVCGDTTTCGTPDEIRTEYEYWEDTFLPSVERRIDAAQGVTLETHYTYDAVGNLLIEDGPNPGLGDAKYYRYDEHGRKEWDIGAADASGVRLARKLFPRDADDKLTRIDEGSIPNASSNSLAAFRRTDYAYDSQRNVARETLTAGGIKQAIVQRSFDLRSQLECEARRMNPDAFDSLPGGACTLGTEGSFGPDRITHNIYDDAGQLLTVQRAYGTPLQQDYATYTYTPNGKRQAVKDANNNLSTFEYDGFDRLQKLRFPVATKGANQSSTTDFESYTYDDVGNRLTLRKRDAKVITSTYDNLNRVRVKTVPVSVTGAPGYNVRYGYDVRGLLAYARFSSDSGQGITNNYDGFGRLKTQTINLDNVTRTVTSDHYDPHGNRGRITQPDGKTFEYVYDDTDRLFNVTENGPSALLASFFYDAQFRRDELDRDTAGAITTYKYDAISRLELLTHDLDGSSTSNDVAMGFTAYNPASQITTREVSNEVYEFPFTAAVKSYTTNGRNQYTQVGGTAFAWDANGNLTDDGPTTFGYDTENRLVSASGAKNGSLKYDPLGRLYEFSAPSPATTTRFVYDGDRLIAEYDGAGALKRRYVHGAGVDEPLVWYEGATVSAAKRQYLHTDHQGSIIAVSTNTGAKFQVNNYDSYGVTATGNTARFQYTGQAAIPELGLLYYKARMYNPALGRFMQTDPIGYDDDNNLYAYVGNDPLNSVDPNGKERWGVNIGFKVALGKVGFRVKLNANFDTETREIGASVTGGYRAGAALEAKGEVYREPSSEQGNQAAIEAEVVGEASAEINAIGGLGGSGEVTAGVSASTEDGFQANGIDASGSVSAGAGSVDSSGRATYSIGGGVGVAAGVDVTVSGNVSVGQQADRPQLPPPDLELDKNR